MAARNVIMKWEWEWIVDEIDFPVFHKRKEKKFSKCLITPCIEECPWLNERIAKLQKSFVFLLNYFEWMTLFSVLQKLRGNYHLFSSSSSTFLVTKLNDDEMKWKHSLYQGWVFVLDECVPATKRTNWWELTANKTLLVTITK